MALTTTTLSSAITKDKVQNIALTNTGGFLAGQCMVIDQEYMWVVSVTSTAVTVRSRGAEGTAAVPHDVNATVMTSASVSDFPSVVTGAVGQIPPAADTVVTIGQDSTITPGNENTAYLINKPTACAITLNSGTAANVGLTLSFVSNTAAAHVITYAGGFRGGVNTVATFAATVGSSLLVSVGIGGQLAILGSSGVTLSL